MEDLVAPIAIDTHGGNPMMMFASNPHAVSSGFKAFAIGAIIIISIVVIIIFANIDVSTKTKTIGIAIPSSILGLFVLGGIAKMFSGRKNISMQMPQMNWSQMPHMPQMNWPQMPQMPQMNWR